MNVGQIRGFLLVHPKPVLVRVHTSDGDTKDIKGKTFAKIAETVHALDPELIELFDKDGVLLRARKVNGSAAQNPSDEPPMPAVLIDDPQAAAFSLYARFIAKAYEHSTEVAFTKMVELVERMGDRADAIEQRLERSESAYRRTVQNQIDDAFERAEEAAEKAAEPGPGDLMQNMASAFLSGAVGGKPAAAARTPNGKGQQ